MRDPATRSDDALQQIYKSTRGYCHACRRKLAFTGYARGAGRGAWDIDVRALRPACCGCLRGHVPQAREYVTRSPAPPVARGAPECRHTLLGGLLGGFALGPWGALLGGLLGAGVDRGERVVRRRYWE